jgi:murein DD-endopeptidase MepM/ murein hydrolase activator NlpD
MASSSETETRVRITAVNQSGAAFQSAARDAQRMANDTERAIQGMSRTMEQFSGSALGMRRALGAASVAFVGGETLRSAAVDYAALDRKMRVLQDTADNDEKARARSAIERLQGRSDALKRLQEISQKTGTPFVELLAGFDARVKSGANTMTESVEQMEDLAMAARAMNARVADVALLATSVQKNLGAKPERLLNWLSMVKSASQEGRFEAEQLAKVMPRLASEMSAGGMNTEKGFATGLAMLETIHDRTGDYEEAERALRDTLQKMNQPELQQRIFDTTGIDMEARLNAVRRVGGDLLAEYGNIVDEALAIRADDLGVPYEKRRELLSFYIREQDALKGTRTLLEDRAKIGEMRDRILKAGADPALMLRRPYEEFSQDAQAALDRLGNSWTKLKMTMGLALEKSGVFVELENIVKFLDEQVSPKVVKLIDQFKAAPFRTAAGFIEDYAAQARVNLEKSHLEGYQDTLGEKRERLTELEKRPEGDRDKRWFREWQRTQQDVSTLEQRIANQQQVIRSWEKYAIDNERKRNENTQEDMEEIKRQREMHTPQEWKDPPPRPQSMLDVPGKPAWYDENRAAGFKGTQVASLDANFLPSTLASEIKPDTPNALGSATETTLARIHDELRQMRGMMRGGGGGAGGGGGWPGMGGTGGGAALPGGGEAPDADVSALGGPPGGGRAGGVTGRVPAGGGEAPTPSGGKSADISGPVKAGGVGRWWTKERLEHGINYLKKNAGLNDMQARAAMARFAAVESPLKGADEPGGGFRGRAQGIGQWLGPRRHGYQVGDFDSQLAKVVREFKGQERGAGKAETAAYARLQAATTPKEAAEAMEDYERATSNKVPRSKLIRDTLGGHAGIDKILGGGATGGVQDAGTPSPGTRAPGALGGPGTLSWQNANAAGFTNPVEGGRPISEYGASREGGVRSHKGIDIGATSGTPIRATTDQTITQAGTIGRKYGFGVKAVDAQGREHVYAHMRGDPTELGLAVGSRIKAGQEIGAVGQTGNARTTPPHLHYEVRPRVGAYNEALNPRQFLSPTAAARRAPAVDSDRMVRNAPPMPARAPLPPRRRVEAAEQQGPPAPPSLEPIVRPGEKGYRGPMPARAPLPPRRPVEAAEQEGPPAPPGPEPIVRPGEYGYRGPRAAAEPAQLDLPDEHTVKIKYDMPDFPRIRERGEGQSRLEMARDMGEARRFAVSDVGVG